MGVYLLHAFAGDARKTAARERSDESDGSKRWDQVSDAGSRAEGAYITRVVD
jgi:hypothetical protein